MKAPGPRPIKGSSKPFGAGMAPDMLLIPGTLALSAVAGFMAYGGAGAVRYGLPATALSFVALLLMTFFVGIGEETLFRGCLQKLLVDRYGVIAGLTIASAIFMPFHIMNSISPLYLLTVVPSLFLVRLSGL